MRPRGSSAPKINRIGCPNRENCDPFGTTNSQGSPTVLWRVLARQLDASPTFSDGRQQASPHSPLMSSVSHKLSSVMRAALAFVLYAIVISALLVLSSCVAPMMAYVHSPNWLLQAIDPEEADQQSIFVAFRPSPDSPGSALKVIPFRELKQVATQYPDISFNLPEKASWDVASGNDASIRRTAESNGAQLIHVFMVGDTPWTSLSEYRVIDNAVYPLRHAHSSPWILLGVFLGPWLTSRYSTRLKRGIYRLIRGLRRGTCSRSESGVIGSR